MVCAKCQTFCLGFNTLTHCGRVTHRCVCRLIIIGSNNGLSPGRRQAIIWTNAGKLLIGPLGTKFSEISIGIYTFSFSKMHLKMLSGKCRPFLSRLQYVNPGIDLCTFRQSCKPIWETQDLWIPPAVPEISWSTFLKACKRLICVEYNREVLLHGKRELVYMWRHIQGHSFATCHVRAHFYLSFASRCDVSTEKQGHQQMSRQLSIKRARKQKFA